MEHVEQLGLELLGPHRPVEGVQAGHRVGTIFGHENRPAVFLPIADLGLQSDLGSRKSPVSAYQPLYRLIMMTSLSGASLQIFAGLIMTLTKPTGRCGSSFLARANSGSKYATDSSVWDSGSLAIDQMTTLGRFLSRSYNSRID